MKVLLHALGLQHMCIPDLRRERTPVAEAAGSLAWEITFRLNCPGKAA